MFHDSSNHSLYLTKLFNCSSPGKRWREPTVRWFDLSFAPMRKVLRTICAFVSLEASTSVSHDFALLTTHTTTTTHNTQHTTHNTHHTPHTTHHTHTHIHIHIHIFTYTAPDNTQKTETGETEELNSEGNEKRRRQRESRVNSGDMFGMVDDQRQ